jgi:hypothetical protein
MTFFRFAAYLAPLAVGFGVAAALALSAGKPWRRRIAAPLGVTGGVLLLLAPMAFTESLSSFGRLAALLGGLAALVAGTHLFFEALRLPAPACQAAACLVVVALMTTVFWFGPILEHAEETGAPAGQIHRRITLALDANPMMVTGYSVFGEDPLHDHPVFYRLGLADYQHGKPSWDRTAPAYAVAGFALFAASLALVALRLRFAR